MDIKLREDEIIEQSTFDHFEPSDDYIRRQYWLNCPELPLMFGIFFLSPQRKSIGPIINIDYFKETISINKVAKRFLVLFVFSIIILSMIITSHSFLNDDFKNIGIIMIVLLTLAEVMMTVLYILSLFNQYIDESMMSPKELRELNEMEYREWLYKDTNKKSRFEDDYKDFNECNDSKSIKDDYIDFF